MKAAIIREHGPVENVTIATDLPVPEPGPDEVRLRVRAAALNYLDIWVRNGWPGIKLSLPHILGADAAGTIDALGANVRDWEIGARVAVDPTLSCGECEFCRAGWENRCTHFSILGEHVSGTFAEYITIPARNLIALPEHVSFAEAAAASLVFVTAWHSLITRGNLRPGESVLVIGAGGGVNTASIQISKLTGCTVYAVGSTDEKLKRAQALGADAIIPRDVEGGWSRAVYQLTAKRGVDMVVDNVGGPTLNDSLRALARGGRVVTVGNTGGPKVEIDNRLVFGKHLSILGSTMGPHRDYVRVMRLLFKGKLKAVIDATYPLDEVQTAMARMEAGDLFGKAVLEL